MVGCRGDRVLGRVEGMRGNAIMVNGQQLTSDAIARVTRQGIYLKADGEQLLSQTVTGTQATSRATTTQTTTGRSATEGEIVVPVAEERMHVGTREAEVGEVQIRKTVIEEQQSIPVELMHEEVHVQERDIQDRPVTAAEAERLFEGATIRVPVRGEEAVVTKEAVVTGEVVIDKERLTETQNVTGTVRSEQVEVEQAYNQRRGEFQQHFTQRQAAVQTGGTTQGRTRTFEEAEPNYRTGFTAAHDERYQGREFDEIEPDLRGRHNATADDGAGWEHLREEIREGWNRARSR
jgi:uncharacterized protein (TIGR02271 family)